VTLTIGGGVKTAQFIKFIVEKNSVVRAHGTLQLRMPRNERGARCDSCKGFIFERRAKTRMLRRIALYAWISLIAIAIISTQLAGSINGVELPVELPLGVIIAFWAVFGMLAAVNFYLMFHRVHDAEQKKAKKTQSSRWK
jgi:uncharacterized integral membrane protein